VSVRYICLCLWGIFFCDCEMYLFVSVRYIWIYVNLCGMYILSVWYVCLKLLNIGKNILSYLSVYFRLWKILFPFPVTTQLKEISLSSYTTDNSLFRSKNKQKFRRNVQTAAILFLVNIWLKFNPPPIRELS
jgi:hypothetical protein